jgi:hypothetical protein
MGTGYPPNEGELLSCLVAFESGDFNPETSPCPWLRTPPPPASPEARAERPQQRAEQRQAFFDFCGTEQRSNLTCQAYESVDAS